MDTRESGILNVLAVRCAQIIDCDEDGFATLLCDDGSTKDDLKIPQDTNPELCEEIKNKLHGDTDTVISVLSAMGEDLIIAVKDASANATKAE